MTKITRPRRRLAVTVLLLSDGYATIAEATLLDGTNFDFSDDGGALRATASAKKEPGDIYDPVIDVNLAVGRALVKLGGQMIRSGNRRVKHAMLEQSKKRVAKAHRPHRARHAKDDWRTLPIEKIRERWGDESARRAEEQRRVHSLVDLT